MESDAILLRRYATGDCAESFRELVRRYAPMVLAVARRVTGDAESAQDVAQESFFELSRHAGHVEGSLAAWMHRVVVSRGIDQRRKIKTRREKELAAAAEQATRVGEAVTEPSWSDVGAVVDEALARLPEEDRVLLLRHYIQGQAQGEIAQAMGVDQSTVSRRIGKGLEALRGELRKLGVTASESAAAIALGAPSVASAEQMATLMQEAGKMIMAASKPLPYFPVKAGLAKAGFLVASLGMFLTILVVGVIAVVMLSNARASARRTVCSTNLKFAGTGTAVYAANFNDQLPASTGAFGGSWMCDMPKETIDTMFTSYTSAIAKGAGPDMRKMFYCPSNTEQDVDKLWNTKTNYRVVGYVWMNDRSATTDSNLPSLSPTPRAALPLEYHSNFIRTPSPSATELALDWILSDSAGTTPGVKWTGISRDPAMPAFSSSHMGRGTPEGANVVCFDGHVEYRKFSAGTATSVQQGGGGSAPYFWFPKP